MTASSISRSTGPARSWSASSGLPPPSPGQSPLERAEAAVVGRPDDLKGQAIAAFVSLEAGHDASESLRKALKEHVAKEIGAFARPDFAEVRVEVVDPRRWL